MQTIDILIKRHCFCPFIILLSNVRRWIATFCLLTGTLLFVFVLLLPTCLSGLWLFAMSKKSNAIIMSYMQMEYGTVEYGKREYCWQKYDVFDAINMNNLKSISENECFWCALDKTWEWHIDASQIHSVQSAEFGLSHVVGPTINWTKLEWNGNEKFFKAN